MASTCRAMAMCRARTSAGRWAKAESFSTSATWERSVRSLKAGGRLVVCGGTSGANVQISLPRLFFKQYEIIGSTMGSYEEFAAVTRLIDQGVAVRIDEVVELRHYDQALARLEQGNQLGKIVLRHPE